MRIAVQRTTGMLMLLVVLGLTRYGRAERPIESPEKATYIVTGTVQRVLHRETKVNDEYLVQIRIDRVEKGEGYKEGEFIYAYAFRRKPNAPLEPAARGHKAVPKEGQRIRALIKRGNGQMEALYPDWFEVLEPTAEN